MRNINLILIVATAMMLMGLKGCGPADDDDSAPVMEPEAPSPEDVKAVLEGIKATEEGILALAMSGPNPNFDACMATTGTLCGIEGALASIDSVAAEMENPDGKFTINGCKFDATEETGTGCEKIKPDVWPLVDPSTWVTQAQTYTDLGFTVAELVMGQSIPSSGKPCKDGNIALGTVRATHKLANNVYSQAALGSFTFDVPSADIDYSTCE